MNGHTSEGDVLEDHCDGIFYKSHPLFSTHDHALQINFHYEDPEICNPLVSKAKINKIGIRVLKLYYCGISSLTMQEFSTSLWAMSGQNFAPGLLPFMS